MNKAHEWELRETIKKYQAELKMEKACYEAKKKLASQLADDWAKADDENKQLKVENELLKEEIRELLNYG